MAALLQAAGTDLQGAPDPIGPQGGGADTGGDQEPPAAKPINRRGAAGKLAAQGAKPLAAPDAGERAETKQLTDQLRKLGYLPQTGAVSQQQLADAIKKFLTEHKDDANPPQDIDSLMALVDDLLAKQNSRQNKSPAQWSGQSPASRPSSLPSGGSYSNAPSPNAGALQQQAAQSVATAHPPPPAGSINAKIADACKNYMGTSTAAGPDHGNLACAWSVNNILSNAGLQKVGSNPNYVPSVEQALQSGRGTAVDAKDAQPGDIVIFPGGHHIGIYMGNGKVANNSSGRAAFVNMSNLQGGMHIYRVQS
jgi:cell wall-associated NlpC family hydrolase